MQQIDYLQNRLHKEYYLPHTELIVKQTNGIIDATARHSELIENLLNKKEQQLQQKDSVINILQQEIQNSRKVMGETDQIAKEVAVQYPNVSTISIACLDYTDTKTLTTKRIPSVYILWNNTPTDEQREQLLRWLKVRLAVSELKLIE
jgi:hypothetical protein